MLRANVELMLAAARANVPVNTVYLARYAYGATLADALHAGFDVDRLLSARRDDYCKREVERARSGGHQGDVFVLLGEQPPPEDMDPSITCISLSGGARGCQRIDQQAGHN